VAGAFHGVSYGSAWRGMAWHGVAFEGHGTKVRGYDFDG